jgi:predicted metal-binding transcription factor (methanogenesis marker protein 9)
MKFYLTDIVLRVMKFSMEEIMEFFSMVKEQLNAEVEYVHEEVNGFVEVTIRVPQGVTVKALSNALNHAEYALHEVLLFELMSDLDLETEL